MIEARNLFRLESRLKKGTKAISVKSLEKDYVLSWILIGITKSKMTNTLCFKGGTALKKIYFPNYRFSEDLDFTLLTDISIEEIEKMLRNVFDIVSELSNIGLAVKRKDIHTNSYVFYINFAGPLGADISKGIIKVDITIREKIIHEPIMKTLLREYDEYNDIPENAEIKVYPLEEIFVEKFLSILDASRNEPRDIYDLWYLVSNNCLEYEYSAANIKAKGLYKGIPDFNFLEILARKESNYKNLWAKRLDTQMIELPEFDEVYRNLRKNLKSLSKALIE